MVKRGRGIEDSQGQTRNNGEILGENFIVVMNVEFWHSFRIEIILQCLGVDARSDGFSLVIYCSCREHIIESLSRDSPYLMAG
jgi:hypothetical protein